MKNKVLIGGLIALAILVLIVIFCFWVGKKGLDNLRDTANTAETTRSNPQSPTAPTLPSIPASPAEAERVFLALGNPSNAGTADPNNFLLVNNYFAISYNRGRGAPNWVAWRISRGELGDFPRPEPDPFRPDARLPKSWKPVVPSDYSGSGYDRGHLAPSADRSASIEGMSETFLMSNMVPQTGDLNRGPWAKLEGYLRTLVTRGSDVYIIAGAYGEKGLLKNKVSVPTNTWKVAVAVPAGTAPSAINESARVIAVDMPNVKGILRADWQVYRTTARDIEQKTGYNLFSNLPANVQNALETKTDNQL